MPIDWAATGTWMQAWAGFAQAGAVGVAAWLGADALKRWRRQKIAEKRFEAAERILTLTFRVEVAFNQIRSGVLWADEFAAAEAQLREIDNDWIERMTPDQRRQAAHGQAILRRIKHFASDWDELIAVQPIARAYFSGDLHHQLSALDTLRHKVAVAARFFGENDGQDQEFRNALQRDLWKAHQPNQNEVTSGINDAIASIVRQLQPVLTDDHSTANRVNGG